MGNPVLREGIIKDSFNSLENEHVMTAAGTITKSCILGGLCAITFAYTWFLVLAGYMDKASLLCNIGIWGGLAIVLFICFGPKNKSLMITTPLYALCEGLALGYISVLANKAYPGVASQAAAGTIFAFMSMLICYRTGLIRCTQKFRAVIITATFAIFAVYLLALILSLFHIQIPYLFSNTGLGIGITVAVIIIAALNLIIDFDNIERYSNRVPAIMEWYFGFSLLITILWMYIEILRLLIQLQSRR